MKVWQLGFSFLFLKSFHFTHFTSNLSHLPNESQVKGTFFFPLSEKQKTKKKKFGGLIFMETWRSFISCVALCCRLTASSSCRRGSGQNTLTSHITHIHPSLHPNPSAASFPPHLTGVSSKGRLAAVRATCESSSVKTMKVNKDGGSRKSPRGGKPKKLKLKKKTKQKNARR